MAKQLINLPFYSMIIILILILVSAGAPPAEAKLCQRRSKTWTGFCANSGNCNRQCRNWERAAHGACHAQFPGVACFCYFNC